MLPPDRALTFQNAPMDELLGVLLRQLKRPLATHGFKLTDGEAIRLASERANGHAPAETPQLLQALAGLVDESRDVLANMGLTFVGSLDTDMEALGGWETTAEFLELANEKSNAELRITVGGAVAMAFGDGRCSPELLHLAAGDYGDETVIARRTLAFATGIPLDSANWLDRIHARLKAAD